MGAIAINPDQASFGELFLFLAAGLIAGAIIQHDFLNRLAAGPDRVQDDDGW